MSNKVIISIVVVVVLLIAVGIGTFLVLNQQNFFSSADQTTGTGTQTGVSTSSSGTGNQGATSCPAPATPATVLLSYPLCESTGGGPETCQFEKAGCQWEAVSGAQSYNVKVTEVETGASVLSTSITAPTVKTSFPVVQGRTYNCQVTAVNSCGSGGMNEDTLLCEADALLEPSPSPTPPPPPPPPPSIAPTPPPVACGATGCSATVPCQAGLICVQSSVGSNYCAKAEYQNQCYRSPGEAACCQAQPTPAPTLPPAGAVDQTIVVAGVGLLLVVLGAAALMFL